MNHECHVKENPDKKKSLKALLKSLPQIKTPHLPEKARYQKEYIHATYVTYISCIKWIALKFLRYTIEFSEL